MNIATIYALDGRGKLPETGMLRRAMLLDEFGECGYFVEFTPHRAVAEVQFRVRRPLTEEQLISLRNLVSDKGHSKAKVMWQGTTPERNREGEEWKNEGRIIAGQFKLEVYSAEVFAQSLAQWLEQWHEDKATWMFNQDSKLCKWEYER
jgi:hypothetical protein